MIFILLCYFIFVFDFLFGNNILQLHKPILNQWVLESTIDNDPEGVCFDSNYLNLDKTYDDVRAFLRSLSTEQQTTLYNFFRSILKDGTCGYVLFGDKPLSIEGWPILETKIIELPGVEQDVSVQTKWLDFWQDLNLSTQNKEYLFLNFEVDYGYHHLVCINRKAFLNTVNENMALFRYVLGPTITAEVLLNELIQSKEKFYDVLKNDNVLLGILLGYGQQNALLVSRKELLNNSFAKDHKEEFPFIAKKIRFSQTKFPKLQSTRPSLGYSSLSEEISALKKLIVTSTYLSPFKYCKIPHFGCEPSSITTNELLAKYKENRTRIITLLKCNDVLEEILKKLFTTTSGTLDIPKAPAERVHSFEKSNESFVGQLVNLILQEIKSDEYFHKSYLEAFLEGVKASQMNKSPLSESDDKKKLVMELYQTELDLKGAKNLESSDDYFSKLDSQNGLIPIVSKKLYYKVLKQGNGSYLSIKTQNVSFHYTYQVLNEGEIEKDAGTIKMECIEFFIPGIAMSLFGMQKGEEREVYIHPEYGYGENSYFPPNVKIIARIDLLDFSEGDKEAIISAPHQLKRRNYAELLKKYETSRYIEFFRYGMTFWDSIKKSKLVDFETFKEYFTQSSEH